MSNWIKVCAVQDIPQRGSRVVKHGAENIAVFRSGADKVFALRDVCPHKAGPLSQGIVHGDRVTCPLHGWNIELESGEAVAPDRGCARRYPVKMEDGMVWLGLEHDS